VREALDRVRGSLSELLSALADRIEEWADLPAMAYTHLQPAEPTTIGYRLAQYGQDLLDDWHELTQVRARIRGKGLKGAVGTSASYHHLLEGTGWTPRDLEDRVMAKLGLEAFAVATQTYPRKQDWFVLNALAGLCATLHKFAFDLRVLQSPPIGEWSEPFSEKQVGSSAMPFKRNPITAENVDSLARLVAGLPRVGWDNAALSLLERTLDDSANRRIVLPEAFLATEEALLRAARLIEGMHFWPGPVERNLRTYGIFAATERVLMEAVKAGGDRQVLHEVIREQSLAAWAAVQAGESNPLPDLLAGDARLSFWLPAGRVRELFQDSAKHVGDAAERTRALAQAMRAAVGERAVPGAQIAGMRKR
jgi:adenylosuccinate lyase